MPAAIAERFHPRPDYLLTVRGDSIELTGVTDGSIVAVRKTAEAKSGQLVVARFGDEVTLKRYVRIDERRVELRPESRNAAHKTLRLDLAKHILDIDGVVVGALITGLDDNRTTTTAKSREQVIGTPEKPDGARRVRGPFFIQNPAAARTALEMFASLRGGGGANGLPRRDLLGTATPA